MSYEGLDELLCETGHYTTAENHGIAAWPKTCPVCDQRWKFTRATDLTNGSGKLSDLRSLKRGLIVREARNEPGQEPTYYLPSSEKGQWTRV